jgi:hypothetical protein
VILEVKENRINTEHAAIAAGDDVSVPMQRYEKVLDTEYERKMNLILSTLEFFSFSPSEVSQKAGSQAELLQSFSDDTTYFDGSWWDYDGLKKKENSAFNRQMLDYTVKTVFAPEFIEAGFLTHVATLDDESVYSKVNYARLTSKRGAGDNSEKAKMKRRNDRRKRFDVYNKKSAYRNEKPWGWAASNSTLQGFETHPRALHENILFEFQDPAFVKTWRKHYGKLDKQFKKMKIEFLYDDPPLVKIDNFVSRKEAAELIELGHEFKLTQSFIDGSRDVPLEDGTIVSEKSCSISIKRSSRSVYFNRRSLFIGPKGHALLDKIGRRMEAWTGLQRQFQDPQFLRYEEGGEFILHHDQAAKSYTMFLYLNTLDDDAGGATNFPHLNVRAVPVAGSALAWWNVVERDYREADELLEHEGQPVLKGRKYAMNLFTNRMFGITADTFGGGGMEGTYN